MNVKRRVFVGASSYPPGSYLTPNGKVLTPGAIAALVGLFQQALGARDLGDVDAAPAPSGGGGGLYGAIMSATTAPTPVSSQTAAVRAAIFNRITRV